MKIKGLGMAILGGLVLTGPHTAWGDGDDPACTIYPCKPKSICRSGDSVCYDQKLREARVAVGNKRIITARELLIQIKADKKSINEFLKDQNEVDFEALLDLADSDLAIGSYESAKRHLTEAANLLKQKEEKVKKDLQAYLMQMSYSDIAPECPKGALCESKQRKPAYSPAAIGGDFTVGSSKKSALSAE